MIFSLFYYSKYYFTFTESVVFRYLSVGAPVYFVVPDGLNYSKTENWDALCSGTGCVENSVTQQISNAARISD